MYTDKRQTLLAAGLTPNAVMMLRPINNPAAGPPSAGAAGAGGGGGGVSCQTELERGEPVGGSFNIASSWAQQSRGGKGGGSSGD